MFFFISLDSQNNIHIRADGDGGLQISSSGLKLEPHSILRLESFLGNFERDFCPLTRLYPEVVNQVSDGLGI